MADYPDMNSLIPEDYDETLRGLLHHLVLEEIAHNTQQETITEEFHSLADELEVHTAFDSDRERYRIRIHFPESPNSTIPYDGLMHKLKNYMLKHRLKYSMEYNLDTETGLFFVEDIRGFLQAANNTNHPSHRINVDVLFGIGPTFPR